LPYLLTLQVQSVGLAIIIATAIVIGTGLVGGGYIVATGDVCGIAAATENNKMLQGPSYDRDK